jgi:ferredoxin-like protein FixX
MGARSTNTSVTGDDQLARRPLAHPPRPRHRSGHLRRLPGLRGELQGVEHRRAPCAAVRYRPLRPHPSGAWLNRVHTYEVDDGTASRTIHFPRSCLHCAKPDCVTVCPTGASYKRAEDGIVLVDEELCIGCGLCAWACPYGARELDVVGGVMKKCTLCIDRIYNENPARRGARAGLRRRLSGACPPLRRPRRSGLARVAPGGRARGLRPHAGARLPAHQQVPAAAPAPRQAGCGSAPELETATPKAASSAGSTPPCRGCEAMHPAASIIGFTVASGAGYGLLALAITAAILGIAAGHSAFRLRRHGPRHRPGRRRARLVDLSSRPPRTGLAGAVAMAHLVAVARGPGGARHLRAAGAFSASAGCSSGRPMACGRSPAGWPWPAPSCRSAARR